MGEGLESKGQLKREGGGGTAGPQPEVKTGTDPAGQQQGPQGKPPTHTLFGAGFALLVGGERGKSRRPDRPIPGQPQRASISGVLKGQAQRARQTEPWGGGYLGVPRSAEEAGALWGRKGQALWGPKENRSTRGSWERAKEAQLRPLRGWGRQEGPRPES